MQFILNSLAADLMDGYVRMEMKNYLGHVLMRMGWMADTSTRLVQSYAAAAQRKDDPPLKAFSFDVGSVLRTT